ncbi:CD99 antigen-like protein 2 isoform X2 [Embiotoca jacksoni]|uniref:CD99 antigen-like protein 2 isoform X2 n=1 Tax=Embiotoca jacksoni TaxID=100190 RepID=UPI003703C4CF
MALRSLLALTLLLLPLQGVLSQDDLNLADALGDGDSKPASVTPRPAAPSGGGGGGGGDFDLMELLDVTTTKAPPKVVPKVPAGTKAPAKPRPKPTAKPRPKPAAGDLDLADALDPNNDIGVKDKNKGPGGQFSDSDLVAVGEDNNYKPDKGKGGRQSGDSGHVNQYDNNTETTAEVGTIAGIVSAVAMALVGAVSSYISYQKKKLCFGIQQSLNTDMVKAENPEVVVATEPQVQQTLLETSNAEPTAEENTV